VSTRAALWSLFALFAVPAGFVLAFNDQTYCHRENLSQGHFWTPDFSSQIVISGDDQSRRIDFTRLQQFKTICVVELYTYGSPYSSKWMQENMRHDGPKACWTHAPNQLTIAGVFENGVPNWTYITLSGPERWYQVMSEACMDTKDAILHCWNDICGFGPQE
jgi:hypothetical protein